MKCPYCQYRDSKVVDSRDAELSIRRRRECLNCHRRFTTYERIEQAALMVFKRDGRREEFSREKLAAGIFKACDKRPIPPETIVALVDDIEAEVNTKPGNEVASSEIGEMAMRRLRDVDEIAYIRFASAYRQFADVDSLREQLEGLIRERERQRFQRDQLPLFSTEEMDRIFSAAGTPHAEQRESTKR